jgi:hypothetical protein
MGITNSNSNNNLNSNEDLVNEEPVDVSHDASGFNYQLFSRSKNGTKSNNGSSIDRRVKVELQFIHNFQIERYRHTTSQWKLYLKFIVVYYYLQKMGLFFRRNENVCLQLYKQTFPLHTCDSIKVKLKAFPIHTLVHDMLSNYIEWLDVNPYHFETSTIEGIKAKLTTLHVYLNECWMFPNRNYQVNIQLLERRLMTMNFTQIQWNVESLSESGFAEDDLLLYRNLMDFEQEPNGFYDRENNYIAISFAQLYHRINVIGYDNMNTKTFLHIVVGHEIFHLLYSVIEKGGKSRQWIELEKQMESSFGKDDLEENLADLFGTVITFKVLGLDRQAFFKNQFRTWCGNYGISGHGSSRTRAMVPLTLLKKEFDTAFSCT